jgi:peptidyl-tRNA hydrolase, PTH1 family
LESEWADFKVVAGLGNPGSRYARTRHNMGFMVLDELCGAHGQGQPISWKDKFGALTAAVHFADRDVMLVKPLSYMNLSGGPIAAVMRFYKFEAGELVVVHDDLDLPFGALRLSQGSGDGGHNGVRSVVSTLGSREYVRLRCGIGRPGGETPEEAMRQDEPAVQDWVLSRFAPQEEERLSDVLQRGVMALEALGRGGLRAAQNKFNREV